MKADLHTRNRGADAPPSPGFKTWFIALLLGAWATTGFSQTVFQRNGTASLLVHAPVIENRLDLRLADVLKITLRVEGPQDLEVTIPDKITQSPGWGVREVSPAGTFDLEGNRRRWEQTFTFEPLAPQTLGLQIEPLRVRVPGAEPVSHSWKPLLVRVTSTITDPNLKELRDQVTLGMPPLARDSSANWPWIALAISALAVFFLGFFLWKKRQLASPALPPERWALRELDRLRALGLAEQGRVERFHTLLANILRRYLEKKFQLPARRRTTPEFLQNLPSCSLDPGRQAFLRAFFERCDLAKFAAASATAAECRALAEQARDFVMQKG